MTKVLFFAVIVLLLVILPISAQQEKKSIADIEKAIEGKDYPTAEKLLKEQVTLFSSLKNAVSLSEFVSISGKLAQAKSGADAVGPALQSIISQLISITDSDTLIANAYLDAVDVLQRYGYHKKAIDFCLASRPFAEKAEKVQTGAIASVEYNLGVMYQRLGDLARSSQHHQIALRLKENDKNTLPEDLYRSYNSIAAINWYASKLDSANYYYDKALATLAKCKPTAVNKFYRTAIIQNNQSAVFNAQGNMSKAMEAQKGAIDMLRQFLQSKEESTQKQDAPSFLFEAVDNYAGFYRELGNYQKSKELLLFSYEQKKLLTPGHPGIFISELLIGQLLNSMREYEQAKTFLNQGLEKLHRSEGDFLLWSADAYYSLGLVNQNTNNSALASLYFSKSDSLFEASYQGQYDNIYLDFLRKTALFYAENKEHNKALKNLDKGYSYLKSVKQEKSMEGLALIISYAEASFISRDYPKTLSYCQIGNSLLSHNIKSGETPLDSIKIELHKPKIILLNAKAKYEQSAKGDSTLLKSLLSQLNSGLDLLNRRKILVDDETSINLIVEENRDLIDFSKKIAAELYELTNDKSYLDQFLAFHESGLYNRLRSRIDKETAIRFNSIPVSVQVEDDSTKSAIAESLKQKGEAVAIKQYTDAIQFRAEWLDKLKTNYPSYYNLRYGTMVSDLTQIQSSVPVNSTLVRYYFTDGELSALVLSKERIDWVKLGKPSIDNTITNILTSTDEKIILPELFSLYGKIWKPIEKFVTTEDLIIVPDGILFSLSFDLLTSQPVKTFSELSDHCLLSKHNISYHYSPLMIGSSRHQNSNKGNYIGFAPGFFDLAKQEYLAALKDSIGMDQYYLNLLPQPFTNSLLRNIENRLGGDLYLNQQSTLENFKQNAGDHNIVHIGTHSEFNNERPELSKIVFSKNAGANKDSNSLFLPDIYNCNIQSDLTLLSSCESGKPGYADGEGMISFAHAFNYAGSKSILTALWKIDEQSTAIITEHLITNLSKKIPTHIALKKAKLTYLQNVQGRMKAPAYWAGMVLLGDPGIIDFKKSSGYNAVLIGGIAIGLAALIAAWRLRKSFSAAKK